MVGPMVVDDSIAEAGAKHSESPEPRQGSKRSVSIFEDMIKSRKEEAEKVRQREKKKSSGVQGSSMHFDPLS